MHGEVQTNGLENCWSLLKRGLKGTYISVEPFHLFRKMTDADRLDIAVRNIIGRRVTYGQLTGKSSEVDARL